MNPTGPVLGSDVLVSSQSLAPSSSLVPVLPESENASASIAPSASLTEWAQWVDFVMSVGTSKLPDNVSKLWIWILNRYRDVPTIQRVALRWWFDKIATFEQQKKLIEINSLEQSSNKYKEQLLSTVSDDIVLDHEIQAYRILNPETKLLEYFQYIQKSLSFVPCSSTISTLIEKRLGTRVVKIPAETGNLIGFLTPKNDKCVFKTLDTTLARTQSSVGAECGIVSNLTEHHIRVKKLHFAGSQSPLAHLMLPDSDDTWVSTGTKQKMIDYNPRHMKDITHQPLCLYMEFLTRILDSESVMSRRWFLSAIEAMNSGLRSKIKDKR
jgi:hypothetical protein